jgi:hypothetical protein
MAAGFPAKATFINGDVYSASDVNDLAGTLNLINPTAKGDVFAGSASNTYTKLAVGANDTVLTADSTAATGLKWATPAAGGMTLLSTTTLSGASTTISSIAQTYNSLIAIVYGVTNATANGAFRLQPNASGSISTWTGVEMFGAAASNVQGLQLGNINLFTPNGDLVRTDANNAWFVQIDNYTSTTNYKPLMVRGISKPVSGTTGAINFAGGINTNSAISSLLFTNTGGNFSTGTVLLYGVK